ncbi:hypothetical protein RND81_05G162000 [Saponaria officinalis]|uniref:F-box domain-containing protein n=1 Tax=Saponaria officinalis TaxID=3572 RepID=A0AAW1KZT1_SAPOF
MNPDNFRIPGDTMVDVIDSKPVSIDSGPVAPETMVDDDIQMAANPLGNLGSKFVGINWMIDNMVDGVEYSRLQWKRKKSINIDTLVEELLVEILCRLPTHKTVVTCKAVCKHWAALLSHPFFITRFIAYKFNNHTTIYPYKNKNGLSKYDEVRMKMTNDRKFGLVVRMMAGKNTRKGLMIHFNDPVHNPNNSSLYSLPRLSNGGLPRNLTIVGSCSDLLLYCRDFDNDNDNDKLKLYISNAQTRQWLALPSLPLNIHRAGPIGLICDPYYSSHTGNVTLNDAYHACIVVIPHTIEDVTEFPAHLLSPNTGGVWRSVLLSLC